MAINVLGVNHKSAPINIREKLIFDKDSIPRALTEIKKIEGVNGGEMVRNGLFLSD